MRTILAALLGCAIGGCSPSVAIPAKPVGLTCKSVNGTIVRLNLDIAARRYRKDGFPSVPIESVTDQWVVLMHETTAAFTVTASIDRAAMSYVARYEELKTHKRIETRYRCAVGPPFAVADAD